MRPSLALRMYSAHLTLFTKDSCGLCHTAKAHVDKVRQKRMVEYTEIDIEAEKNKKWKDIYDWDVPVLHVERVMHTYSKPNIVTQPQKLFHRFSTDEIEKLIDEAEQVISQT